MFSKFGSLWARGALGLVLLASGFVAATAQVADTGVLPKHKPEAPVVPQGKAATATEIVDGQKQMPFIQSNSSKLLQDALAKYSLISEQDGFPRISAAAYRKGERGGHVALLNRRLHLEGYLRFEGTQGQYADLVTTATLEGVRRFQRNHGIAVTGKVDKATIAELNVSVEARMATIEANIARLAAYQDDLTERYIVVNVPSQQLEAVSKGRVFQRHNVIVGRPARPSPVVITPLKRVKFNPYWNAPQSIVEKDILPKLQAGQLDYLTQLKMRIFLGDANGPEMDPKTLDFKTLDASKYLFREDPGPHSSMATAKIEFSSPFGIYLHDTPDKNLYAYDNRFFSSGCIRVQNMQHMVNWILDGQDGIGTGRIKELEDTLEQIEVDLVEPPELRVVYLTAWAAQGGTVAFRKDIYELDGSGFITGQPLPPGELTADGKRFMLKPMPRTQSVDALEAEGRGFLGAGRGVKLPPPVQINDLKKSGTQKIAAASAPAGAKAKGLFDWDAYRKKQAAEYKTAVASKVKLIKSPLVKVEKVKETKVATTEKPSAKPATIKDPKAKTDKNLDCKLVPGGKLPKGCPVPVKTAAVAKVP